MNNVTETWRSYATICRLCLQKDGFMLGIFNHIQGKDKSIYKKIIDCTALQISHGDGLPNVICHRCLYKIEFCLEFRQLCFMSDATLRQLNGVMNKENGSDGSNNNSHLPLYEQLGTGNDSDVVMVVDPMAYDYESDYESDKEAPVQSDAENGENGETNDEPESRGVSMCKFCDHAFSDPAECHNHELSAHDSDQPYNCGSCYMGFADRVLYSAHLKSVHKNDKPYNCPQCDRTFARRSDLRKHTIVHTGVKPFTCPVCQKSFSRNTNLSKHIRIHQGAKPFVCPKCPKTFTSKTDLARHQNIHIGQRPFVCRYCRISFSRRDKLARHERRHFPQRPEGGNVENSEDRQRELARMRETLAIYGSTTENRTEAEDVKQETGSEKMIINLDPFNHNDYSVAATPQRVGECSESEPQTEQETLLPERIKLKDLQEEYKMIPQLMDQDLTGEAYSSGANSLLDEDRPFRCTQCPKRFAKWDVLQSHLRTHSGVRPFVCPICGKTFGRKRELDRHAATHSGARPFKCPRCSKSFGRKDKMMRHARIHDATNGTGKGSYSCTMCPATFSRKYGLHQHVKLHETQEEMVDQDAMEQNTQVEA